MRNLTSMAAACCLLQDPSNVLGTMSAAVLAVLELLLAAITLLRFVFAVGVALVARLLPCQESDEPWLCCMVHAKGHAAHHRRGESTAGVSTGPQQQGDRSCLSACSCVKGTEGPHNGTGAELRDKTWSEGSKDLEQHYLKSKNDICRKQHTLPEGPSVYCVPAPNRAAGSGCSCKPTPDCPGGSAGPSILLSEVQTRSTPRGISLQLHPSVEAAGTRSPYPCEGRDCSNPSAASSPPAPTSGSRSGLEAWAAVEELQHELEEERRAAEVAAAEALKMIARLQSEKAGLEARLRAAAQAEVEASLQRDATLDVLEEVVAQLEAERTALQHENACHRECLAKAAKRWQAGCAGFVLLEAGGKGGSGRGGTALQRHRTLGLLEGRNMGLLLTNGMHEAGLTLEKRKAGLDCKDACGVAGVASMRPGVLTRLPNGWCGRGQGNDLPASPQHDQCRGIDEGLKDEGLQSGRSNVTNKGEGNAPAQEQGLAMLGRACPLPLSPMRERNLGDSEGGSSSSRGRHAAALQRHISLVLHPVTDDPGEKEGACGMEVEVVKEKAQQHPCHASDGVQPEAMSANQAAVENERGLDPKEEEAGVQAAEGELSAADPQSSMAESWGGDQLGCNGGAAVAAVDLCERASMDEPHLSVGGCSSPVSGLSPEIALPACATPVAGEADELAGKLASRRQWEQEWEDKGRSLWTSPSMLIRAESRQTRVRRSLFANSGDAKMDDAIGDSRAKTLRRVEPLKLLESHEKLETSPTVSGGQAPLGSSAGLGGTETLSSELALKLASRRKWEV